MIINWKHQTLVGLRVEKDTTKSHPTCDGLRLRLYASGRKVWEWNRTAKRRRIKTTLGQFPAMGMAVAEERARELNAQFDLGFDPLASEIHATSSPLTIRAALETRASCSPPGLPRFVTGVAIDPTLVQEVQDPRFLPSVAAR